MPPSNLLHEAFLGCLICGAQVLLPTQPGSAALPPMCKEREAKGRRLCMHHHRVHALISQSLELKASPCNPLAQLMHAWVMRLAWMRGAWVAAIQPSP
eukprot:1146957-Pelagomonas_calceolata.AAC.2